MTMELTREQKFGQVIAILIALSECVFDKDTPSLATFDAQKIRNNPEKAVAHMHQLVMQHTHKFGEHEFTLLDILSEKMNQLTFDEFNHEPLDGTYWQAQTSQLHFLNNMMSVKQAAEYWDVGVATVRRWCGSGKIKAHKVGEYWIIDKNQSNPKIKGVD